MPTYDYECNACGHQFELFQGINDPIKRKCPECGRLKLQRLFGTGAAVVFKGSGFYETDYRSADYKKAAAADKKSQESSKEKSTDTKSKSSGENKSSSTNSSSSSGTSSSGGSGKKENS
ncbi:MAG TPA: zinc ribbon domain-containing protein [Planctomycetes bacterium]|jgi:putative FmdB family regulatory protein|nr:zinc ribbon domain-containing protein [Planctomycetaceae bacterium]HIN94298.1 zinc ribbon domain-containing protein [Planctomycetota bacterium]